MRVGLYVLIIFAFLMFIYGTFVQFRDNRYWAPFSTDLAFMLMTWAALVGVSLL